MERSIIYIINPISGTRNKQSLRAVIEAKTKTAGIPYQIHHSVIDGDYSFLYQVIKEEGITDVVIAGGDGTINQVVGSLKDQGVQFGIIPCGSGNGLALCAGIPKNTEKALDIVFAGKSMMTDAFMVNDKYACMLCGLGFDAQVAYDFANDPNRGLMTYIKKCFQNFFSSQPYPFEIMIDGKEIVIEAFFISIANSNQYGNNFKIAPQASLTDGLLDIVIVTKQNKLNMLLQTIMQVSGFNKLQEVGSYDQKASVLYFQAKGLHIKNPNRAPLHIDGDPAATVEEVEIKVLEDSFRLITA